MHAAEISVEIQRSFVLLSFPGHFLPVCIRLKISVPQDQMRDSFHMALHLDNSITYVNET